MLILKKTEGKALEQVRSVSPEEVVSKVKDAGLTGRGGAGFSTGIKWEFLRKSDGERILVCNADEGEPGTFKDRYILQNNPELLIEGIHVACYALEVKQAYIYLRGEYRYFQEPLQKLIDSFPDPVVSIEIILGAGAYICGDETSILNSIEGERGFPRHKPPFPTDKGLFGKPTCINNVETLANVPLILTEREWNPNLRLFSVSGDVENPGIFEEDFHITLGELIAKAKPKEPVKAISFGAAGGVLPYDEQIPLTIEALAEKGINAIRRSLIVIGQSKSIIDVCRNLAQFFVHESCGKCFPCREGTAQVLRLIDKIKAGEATKDDLSLLQELGEYITDSSFCGLGQTAYCYVQTSLRYFKEEFDQKCK